MANGKEATPDDIFNEAVKMHNLGIDGDAEAVKKACQMFETVCADDPKNTLAEAYLGSATALLARDEKDLEKRFKQALEGLKMLDRAVSKEPKNIDIRTLRGYVCYNLPEMYFHRLSTAVEDFSFLVSQYRKSRNTISHDFYCKLLFDLGSAYKKLEKNNEAEATWKKLLSVTKDPKYWELLRQEGFDVPNSVSRYGSKPAAGLSGESLKQFEEAKEMHRRALAGDKTSVQKAFESFEKLHKEAPYVHLVLAYYADCLSMAGLHSDDHSLLFGNAIKAMINFDKAVKGDPDNVEIRLLRSSHSLRLPEIFFRRSATAMGDLEYLIQRYEQDNRIFDDETYIMILDKLAEVHRRMNMREEANSIWAKLFSLTGDSKYKTLSEQSDEETHFDPVKARSMTWKQALQEGIRLHNLGVKGNKKAAKIAEALLKGLHKERPGNAVITGYYGSSMALVGRDSSEPGIMFSNGIKGLKLVQQAVALDSTNPQLRILRGYLTYNLPETFFHMTTTAIQDFRYLIQAYTSNKSIIPKQLYWQILYDLGAAYTRVGDDVKARKVWAQLLKETDDPKYAAMVKQ